MIIASDVTVDAWRGSMSLFKGARSTRAFAERASLSWSDFVKVVAPEQPRLDANKEDGEFFLPTVLREAPLVGATLERARDRRLPLVGKMRSANHVVEGAVVKLDLDGIDDGELTRVLKTLDDQNIAFVFYSTHSNGLKPNIRARLLLPIDKPAAPYEYRQISRAVSEALLGKTLDNSEGFLHQLAGTYIAHPSRISDVLRLHVLEGFCISSSALLAAVGHDAAKAASREIAKPDTALTGEFIDWEHVKRAVAQLNAGDFQIWRTIGMMLKALGQNDFAKALWLEFTDGAAEAFKKRNHEACYDPEVMWERFTPYVTADVAAATIFARARDAAEKKARPALERGTFGNDAEEDAIQYIARYHTRLADELIAEHEPRKAARGRHGSKR